MLPIPAKEQPTGLSNGSCPEEQYPGKYFYYFNVTLVFILNSKQGGGLVIVIYSREGQGWALTCFIIIFISLFYKKIKSNPKFTSSIIISRNCPSDIFGDSKFECFQL